MSIWLRYTTLSLYVSFILGLMGCSQPGYVQETSEMPKRSSQGHEVELSWAPPTARADGAGISAEELGGYKIYYGTSPESMDKVIDVKGGSKTTYIIENLSPRTYYFAITAYDSAGRESRTSEVISNTVDSKRETSSN